MPPMDERPAVDAQLSTRSRAVLHEKGGFVISERQVVWQPTAQELNRLAEVWSRYARERGDR
jgi:hypothetical protein